MQNCLLAVAYVFIAATSLNSERCGILPTYGIELRDGGRVKGYFFLLCQDDVKHSWDLDGTSVDDLSFFAIESLYMYFMCCMQVSTLLREIGMHPTVTILSGRA